MQLFSRNKAIVALSLGALALGACGDDVTVPVTPDAPITLSITPPSALMNVGESLNFAVQISGGSVTNRPTLASCVTSSATVVTATVAGSTCRVTAVAAGNATITATASTGQVAAASVSVAAPAAAISGLSVSPSTAQIAVGQTVTVTPNVTRANAAVTLSSVYSTSNVAVATVNATTGVVTAVAPGTTTITVNVTGTGTGFTSTTLTGASSITVTALPQGITALTVQPTSLLLALGSTAQLAASATQPAGAAAATITYGTTVPGVATVTAAGVVTAVAPGTAVITVTATSAANANFAAATLTQLVPVTVSPSANVTIQTVTQGPTITSYSSVSGSEGIVTANNVQVNQPIDITNVRDQIQVTLNLQPNNQKTDSAVIFIANADGTGRRAASRQIFSNGVANAGDITLFVNTADFTANFTTGAADVFFPNGQKIISASVFTSQANGSNPTEVQSASNNRQVVNFNNLDGYAARYVSPTRNAVGTGNLTWWGGPDAAGQGSYSIVPVFYTPLRTVTRIDIGLRQGTPAAGSVQVCSQTGQIVSSLAGAALQTGSDISIERYTALPFSGTYNGNVGRMTLGTGASTSFTTAANGNIECRGLVHANSATAQNFVSVEAGTDNFNNPAPIVTRFDGYRTSAQVLAIVPNRLDYAGPETVEPDIRRTGPGASATAGYPTLSTLNATWAMPAVTGWVNANFNFQTQTPASTETNGVGLPTTASRAWRYQGCNAGAGGTLPTTDTVSVLIPSNTGADIPECSTNNQGGYQPTALQTGTISSALYGIWTRGPFRAVYIEADLLGNVSNSPRSAPFGVDKTAPLIRIATASDADTAVAGPSPLTATSRSIRAEVIDERSGFIDVNDEGAQLRLNAANTYSLVTANFGSFQHFASRGASSANPTTLARTNATNINCINPNSTNAMIASLTDPFNTGVTTASFTAFGANPITAPTCSFINRPASDLAGFLSDGYRPTTSVTFGSDGIYTYRSRVFDRAGNVSNVIGRSYSVENIGPTVSDLNVPGSISASAVPTFGSLASASVELRAYNTSVIYPAVGNRFIYPQTLINARFDDVIGSQYTGTVTLPTAAPMVTALENTLGGNIVPTFTASPAALTNITNINSRFFNTSNMSAVSSDVGFASVSLPSLTSIGGINGNTTLNNLTTWRVMNLVSDFQAGFNAPVGLKAQLRGNTNVPNPPFVRTDFYRLNSATSNYEYLGSASSAAQTDIGSDRFWTWTLTSDLYARTPTSLETTQTAALLNENIIAIGVRGNGAGLATSATTIGGASINFFGITQVAASSGACSGANSICFVQAPAGFPQTGTSPAANITVSTVTANAPITFAGATVTTTGILPVDVNGGTYAITTNSVVINGVTYTPSIVGTFQNVSVAANTLTNLPFRIVYSPVLLGLNVVTSPTTIPQNSTVTITLTGTAGAATGITVGPVILNTGIGQLVPVPAAGTYSLTLNTPALSSTVTVGSAQFTTPAGPNPLFTGIVVGGPVPTQTITWAPVSQPFTSQFLAIAGTGFDLGSAGVSTAAGGPVSVTGTAGNGGVVAGNPFSLTAAAIAATNGVVTTVLATFPNSLPSSPFNVASLGTYQVTLAPANFAVPTAQVTTFGGVITGTSLFNANTAGATITFFPAQLSINVTGQPSVLSGTSPANWVLPTTTLSGPNGYSTPFAGDVAPLNVYTGFESLQIGGSIRPVIVPVASPGVGSYQIAIPNTQVIGGTTFTISNCAAGAPTGSPSGVTGGAGAAVLSAQVTGGNCLLSINATYGSVASPILINYTAP